MASWGLVTTLKAADDKILAFVAHHLSIGASHIWLYFDDPLAPVPPALSRDPRVTVTLCDDVHWASVGKSRPPAHQNRQTRNARHAIRRATTDWLAHIDVDEFLLTARPLADMLDEAPPDRLTLKFEPFEAMHDPLLPDDIFTAREFRGPLRHEFWRFRRRALGDYRRLFRDGMLSHSVGKVIFRTGVPKLQPKIHGVLLDGAHVPTPNWLPDARLLHFHAQDRAAWLAALPFRLTLGAYQFQPDLQAFLSSASPDQVDDFYLKTQVLPKDLAQEMEEAGRVAIVDLALRRKVAALLAGQVT